MVHRPAPPPSQLNARGTRIIPHTGTNDQGGPPEPTISLRCSLLRLHAWRRGPRWLGTKLRGQECARCGHRRLVVLWPGKGTIMDIPYPKGEAWATDRNRIQTDAQDAATAWLREDPHARGGFTLLRAATLATGQHGDAEMTPTLRFRIPQNGQPETLRVPNGCTLADAVPHAMPNWMELRFNAPPSDKPAERIERTFVACVAAGPAPDAFTGHVDWVPLGAQGAPLVRLYERRDELAEEPGTAEVGAPDAAPLPLEEKDREALKHLRAQQAAKEAVMAAAAELGARVRDAERLGLVCEVRVERVDHPHMTETVLMVNVLAAL